MQITPKSPIRLALIAYPGVQQSALGGLADLFHMLPTLPGGGDAVVEVQVADGTAAPAICDAFLFPPSIEGARPAPDDPLVARARNWHAAGALGLSACAGAFWLARAGLLDGRPATTHWALEEEFRRTFPQVALHPNHILIDDRDMVTAGGLMAWIDLGLHLTGRWFGPALMMQLSRQLLVDPGGRAQQHYRTFQPNYGHGDEPILKAQRLIAEAYARPLTVPALAGAAGLSSRTLQRRFEAATGRAPSDYIQTFRIEKAKAALELGSQSQAAIGWSVGYSDPSSFVRAFRLVTGLSPGAYRTRFCPSLVRPPPAKYLEADNWAEE